MNAVALALGLALQSPRLAETFSGTAMLRPAISPLAIVVPSSRYTNSFSWTVVGNQPWQTPDGYRLYQYSLSGITNTYETGLTTITISYNWPDTVDRWFYYVVATNEWGDSEPSRKIHFPLYPADRMDLYVTGTGTFILESSMDRNLWISQMVTGRTTVLFVGAQRFFRSPGMLLKCEPYNPLNQ